MINRKVFFGQIRPMFPGSRLTQSQDEGINQLLDVWFDYYAHEPLPWLAYCLATAFHETAYTMQPIEERGPRKYFDKYEPGTRIGRVLGNTKKGDGWRFKGAGHVMNTGRVNAAKATKRLNAVFGLTLDLVTNPEKRLDPFVSAHSLFLGNIEGWWTGKALSRYIDDIDESDAEDYQEYLQARWVVNGKDKREKIARQAMKFEAALRAAEIVTPISKPKSWLLAIIDFIISLWKGR